MHTALSSFVYLVRARLNHKRQHSARHQNGDRTTAYYKSIVVLIVG